MVEFYGNCADEVVKQTREFGIVKKYGKLFSSYTRLRIFVVAALTVIFAIGVALLTNYIMKAEESTERSAAIFGICVLSPLTIAGIIIIVRDVLKFPKTRYSDIYWTYDIKIDELRVDWYIYDKNGVLIDERRAMMSNIESVLESELCYYIIIKKNTMIFERFIVCQKDLIIEGDLNEFKEYFGKKIKQIKLKEKKKKSTESAAAVEMTNADTAAEDETDKNGPLPQN